MSELTPAQRLRVAAALTGVTHNVTLTRGQSLELARAWEAADNALVALEASNNERERRMQKLEDWSVRTVTAIGLAQAVAFWWLI